jgi:hypothetical protein
VMSSCKHVWSNSLSVFSSARARKSSEFISKCQESITDQHFRQKVGTVSFGKLWTFVVDCLVSCPKLISQLRAVSVAWQGSLQQFVGGQVYCKVQRLSTTLLSITILYGPTNPAIAIFPAQQRLARSTFRLIAKLAPARNRVTKKTAALM